MFDDWAPDKEVFENPCIDAKNVWPSSAGGFEPALDYSQYSTVSPATLPNSVYGVIRTGGADLSVSGDVNVIGASQAIYAVDNVTATDKTSSLGLTTTQPWEFASFQDSMVAVTTDQAPIAWNFSGDFVLLTGSPPSGAITAAGVRDFLVLGGTLESGEAEGTRVRWSGFNNMNTWGSDASTQADFQDLPDRYGRIRKIVPGSVGYIFQENAITQMTYVGPPVIFRFDRIAEGVGLSHTKGIAWQEDNCFFHSHTGFHKLSLSSGAITPIGDKKVNKWYKDATDGNTFIRLFAAIDKRRSLVFFAFKDSDVSLSGQNTVNRILVYNYFTDRWSYMDEELSVLGPYELNDDPSSPRENSALAIKSPTASTSNFGFFDGFGTAIGDNVLDATITTGDYGSDGAHVYLDGARPLVDNAAGVTPTITARCNYRTNLLQKASADGNTGDVAVNAIGRADFRVSARYFRFLIKTTGKFARLLGVEVNPRPSGGR